MESERNLNALKALVEKWRKEAGSVVKPKAGVLQLAAAGGLFNCADELEAALAVSEPGQVWRCPYCNVDLYACALAATTDKYGNVCHRLKVLVEK